MSRRAVGLVLLPVDACGADQRIAFEVEQYFLSGLTNMEHAFLGADGCSHVVIFVAND